VGKPAAEVHPVSDNRREALLLRTIRVSALTALQKPMSMDTREALRDRADVLLGDLEAKVILDGGDEETLAAIERTRRDVRG
jgi:hypothetical protein